MTRVLKRPVYECCGVKELWYVDRMARSVYGFSLCQRHVHSLGEPFQNNFLPPAGFKSEPQQSALIHARKGLFLFSKPIVVSGP